MRFHPIVFETLNDSKYPGLLLGLFALLAVWELAWKGTALWRAARNNDQIWYVLILILNTAGILPIIYILLDKNAKSKK